MESSIPPFYVGQQVICIDEYDDPALEVGKQYQVGRVVPDCCEKWNVTVGVALLPDEDLICEKCGREYLPPHGLVEYPFYIFRAVTENMQAISFSEINEQVLTSVN